MMELTDQGLISDQCLLRCQGLESIQKSIWLLPASPQQQYQAWLSKGFIFLDESDFMTLVPSERSHTPLLRLDIEAPIPTPGPWNHRAVQEKA